MRPARWEPHAAWHPCPPTWLQSRRMKRATNQQIITLAFEASQAAVERLTHLVPDLDRDRAEFSEASVLLEEAWVSER